MQVLELATVTPGGEPRVAPVDGLFFRGRFWFGSAEDSLRFRNIRANPAVSGAVTKGLETFLVIVHGRAVETDPRGPEAGGFAAYPREVYDFDWDAATPTRRTRGSTRARCSRSSGSTGAGGRGCPAGWRGPPRSLGFSRRRRRRS